MKNYSYGYRKRRIRRIKLLIQNKNWKILLQHFIPEKDLWYSEYLMYKLLS